MIRQSHINRFRRLEQYGVLLFLLISIITITIFYLVVDQAAAIRGSYLLIGVGLAFIIRSTIERGEIKSHGEDFDLFRSISLWKIPAIGLMYSIVFTLIIGYNIYVISIFLIVSSASILVQIRNKDIESNMVIQILSNFLIVPISKILGSGFYYGNVDSVWIHYPIVNGLLQSGRISSITHELYQHFPGLHILSAILSALTGLEIHSVSYIIAIGASGLTIFGIYLLSKAVVTDISLSICVVLAFSLLQSVKFYSTIYFPQSLALPLLIMSYFSFLESEGNNSRRLFVGFVIFIIAVITHHVTVLLFMLLVLSHKILHIFEAKVVKSIPTTQIGLSVVQLGLMMIIAIGYWSIAGTQFYLALLTIGSNIVGGAVQRLPFFGTNDLNTAFVYGEAVRKSSTFDWLMGPEAIYYIMIVSLLFTSTYVILNRDIVEKYSIPSFLAGLLVSPLMIKTPFAFKGINRVRYMLAIFFAFPVGLGIAGFLRSEKGRKYFSMAIIGLLIIFSISSPWIGYQQGREAPNRQFSDRQVESLKSVGEFSSSTSTHLSTFWVSRVTLHYWGYPASSPTELTEEGIEVNEGLYLTSLSWSERRIIFRTRGSYLTSVSFSEGWLNDSVSTENKIYANGEYEMLWVNKDGHIIDNNR